MRFFISSTSRDLQEHRIKAQAALRRLEHTYFAMEDYVAEDRAPVEKCLADVARSDAYIGIFARRYGFLPEHYDESITALEYRRAVALQIPRLLFLLDDSVTSWPHEFTDEGEPAERLRSLRAELSRERVVSFFTNPDELASLLTSALSIHAAAFGGQRVLYGPFADTRGFRDRLEHLASMRRLLGDRNVKLVFVVGRSGIGKTWLLSRVSSEIQRGELKLSEAAWRAGADGMIYFRCGKGDQPTVERLYRDFALLLGRRRGDELTRYWQDPARSLAEKIEFLLSQFQEGCYLLLFDNFEDALAPNNSIADQGLADFVTACLTTPHALRLIAATRRAPLLPPAVEGAYGTSRANLILEHGLPEEEAVGLLRELDVGGALEMREAPEEVLRDIVHRVHGVPRALATLVGTLRHRGEGWTLGRLLSDPEALARFENDPARELYESLSPPERLATHALATLERPAGIEEIAALLPGLEIPAPELMDRLITNHVVSFDREAQAYSLHPSDARYCYSQIPSDRSAFGRSQLHARAAAHLTATDPHRDQWRTYAELAPELQAFRHLLQAEDFERAYRLLETFAFGRLWLWGECELVADLHEQLEGQLRDRRLHQVQSGNLALAYWSIGRYEESLRCSKRALSLAQWWGDRPAMAAWLGNMGLCHYSLGQLEQAVRCQRKALRLDLWSRNWRGKGIRCCDLGVTLRGLGRTREAIGCSARGIVFSRRASDVRVECNHLANLGFCHLLEDDVHEARRFFAQGLALGIQSDSAAGKYYHYRGLSHCAFREGDHSSALKAALNAQAIELPMGSHRAALLVGLAHLSLGDSDSAEKALLESAHRCDALLTRCAQSHDAHYCRACAQLALGRPDIAREEYARALAICSAPGVIASALLDLTVLDDVASSPESQGLVAHLQGQPSERPNR